MDRLTKQLGDLKLDAATLYQQALQCEQNGDMTQAIELYRRAFQLDPDIHHKVKPVSMMKENRPVFTPVVEGAWDLLHASNETERPKQTTSLLGLNMRVLVRIGKWLGTMHLPSLERMAQTSRVLYVAGRDASLWRLLSWWQIGSNRRFKMHFQQRLEAEQSAQLPPNLISRFVFWSALPLIHFDGVYIAQLGYYRQGMPALDSSTNLNPILHVVYWRYLRFWNGTNGWQVTSLCTTDPPKAVIPKLRYPEPTEHAIMGKWQRLSLAEDSDPAIADRFIRLEMSEGGKQYDMTLFIRPGARSLVCQEYTVRQTNHDPVEIEVASWKRFYFSRVRSYTPI